MTPTASGTTTHRCECTVTRWHEVIVTSNDGHACSATLRLIERLESAGYRVRSNFATVVSGR